MTLNVMSIRLTLSITTFNIMRLSIRTPNMMTLSIMKLNMTTLGMADKNVLACAAIKNVILVDRLKAR